MAIFKYYDLYRLVFTYKCSITSQEILDPRNLKQLLFYHTYHIYHKNIDEI